MELFEYIDYLDKPFDIFYTDSVASPRHWHYYSEILYIRQGSIKVICNDGKVILDEGDVCYFYPLQLHEVTKAQEGKVDYAVVKFDIHTIHIPEAYLQKIYDYFVRRSSEKDFCLLLSTKKQTEELGQLIVNTVEEYQKKQDFLTAAISSVPTKNGRVSRRNSRECVCNFTLYFLPESCYYDARVKSR